MTEPTKDATLTLIEQAKQLKIATDARIKELLKEDAELDATTAKRRSAIKEELKSLGWKPTRIKRTAKSETKAAAAK